MKGEEMPWFLIPLGVVVGGALALLGRRTLQDPDADLFQEPKRPSVEDLLWLRYLNDPRRFGPRLTPAEASEDTAAPSTRKLTALERWALEPFFPVASDLDRTIHLGLWPPWLPSADKLGLPPGTKLGGITDPETGDVWFPERHQLWQRFWLSILAHELTHGAQIRIGATRQQAADALRTHGYVDSPLEVQARWMQRRVLDGLAQQARDFYARQVEQT